MSKKGLLDVKTRFVDDNGDALAGGKLYSYDAGTSTPRATYTDQTEGTANANPTILDANGEADIWLDSGDYRLVLDDSSDVEIFDVDNISIVNDSAITNRKLAKHCVTTAKIVNDAINTAKIEGFAVTEDKINDDAVTSAKINDDSVTIDKIPLNLDFSAITDYVDVVFNKNLSWARGKVRAIAQHLWESPSKVSFGAHFSGTSVWSPGGEFLYFERKSSQKTLFYKRMGNEFNEVSLIDPGDEPADIPSGMAVSHDGNFFAYAMATTSPYGAVFEKDGNGLFTKLTVPAPPVSAGTIKAYWSPDDKFLFFSRGTTQSGYLYKRTGSTLEYIRLLPGFRWNRDGRYVAGIFAGASAVTLYEQVENVFFEVSTVDSDLTTFNDLQWSPDGSKLAVAITASPYVQIYDISGTTFTKRDDPATLPAGQGNSVTWSPSGRYLAVGHNDSPYITIYEVTANSITKLSDPASLPDDDVTFVSWSPDTRFLVAHHTGTTPFLSLYETGHSFPDNALIYHKESYNG